jgi:hypothetical protein
MDCSDRCGFKLLQKLGPPGGNESVPNPFPDL